MKKFLHNYLKIVAMTLTGLIFMISSFFLFINYYHYEELKRPLYISDSDLNYTNYNTKLETLQKNLIEFNNSKNKYKPYETMYNHLVSCYNAMKDSPFSNMKTNTYYAPNDIFEMGSKFQTNVINVCWALHLSYLKTNSEGFNDVAPLVVSEVNVINNQISNALREIQNNSSYFYTTNITSTTVRNYLLSDYTAIANSYNDFADIVLNLSFMINKGV